MIYLQTASYNVDVAKVFGVCTAIMLSYLDRTFTYQSRNKLLNANSTMSISRAEIYAETGLDDEKQKEIELALQECGVITVRPLQNVPNKNYYIVNDTQLVAIMTAKNPSEVIGETKAKQFTNTPRVEPISKRQSNIIALKKKVKVEDPVIQTYLIDWIDSVFANPKGFLSPKGVEIAQQELYAYCRDDQAKAIKILEIAIKGGLRDLSWAIENYEKTYLAKDSSRDFANYNDTKSLDKNESGEVY